MASPIDNRSMFLLRTATITAINYSVLILSAIYRGERRLSRGASRRRIDSGRSGRDTITVNSAKTRSRLASEPRGR